VKPSRRFPALLHATASAFSSLRLTVVLLAWGMVLVFGATLAQVELGIHEVQERYLRSWIAWFDPMPGERSVEIPLPGGMLLGALLLANLLAAHARRFEFRWRKAGLILVHAGIILLLLGELFTATLADESQMRLDEGHTRNYSISPRELELAIIERGDDGLETVTAIPQERLEDGARFDLDGMSLRVVRWIRNGEIQSLESATPAFDPARADRGPGAAYAVLEQPPETAMDRRDLSSVFVELLDPTGAALGTWLLSNGFATEQEFEIGGRSWRMSLRPRRFYHPFSIHLIDFSHDRYLGTNIPKNFSSRVRVTNPDRGENRETLIYMNHPLRYQGLTFYQAGFDNNDRTSILQVVRNPAWTMPYISCAMVGLGLLWIFSQHLAKAVSRRRATTPTAS